jgi:hypothetical protein
MKVVPVVATSVMAVKEVETSVARSGSGESRQRHDSSLDELLTYIEGDKEDGKRTRTEKLLMKKKL